VTTTIIATSIDDDDDDTPDADVEDKISGVLTGFCVAKWFVKLSAVRLGHVVVCNL